MFHSYFREWAELLVNNRAFWSQNAAGTHVRLKVHSHRMYCVAKYHNMLQDVATQRIRCERILILSAKPHVFSWLSQLLCLRIRFCNAIL